jgi:hypothetical protein
MNRTSQKAPVIGQTGVKYEAQSDALLGEVLSYLHIAYEFDGNDILVETIEREDLRKMMGASRTVSGALWAIRVKSGAQAIADYRADVIAAGE